MAEATETVQSAVAATKQTPAVVDTKAAEAAATKQTNDAKAAAAAAAKRAEQEAEEDAHKLQMRSLELEAKRLEIQEKTANLEDLTDRLDERKMKREAVRQKAYTNGATLKDTQNREAAIQKRCNHHKGGNGAAGIQLGQGDSPQHAVIKHTMLNGDLWVRCTRCGKTWKPPIKKDYLPGGVLETRGVEGYVEDLSEYEKAKNFQTNNNPSASQRFEWSDKGEYSREVLRATTLR